MSTAHQRVALVVPFFGNDLRGRKERFAYDFATHLALEGVSVEVLTTTARDESPDENFYHAGNDNTEPFSIQRFRVTAPDRVAYAEAVLALEQDGRPLQSREYALVDERLRSADLLAHIRAVGDTYDAFVFVDATAPTTVRGVAEVAERALLLPLLDDVPLARLPAVGEALRQARLLLCTTEAEAALAVEVAGPSVRSRIRMVGMGIDVVPVGEVDAERIRRAMRGRSYVLATGDDAFAIASMRSTDTAVVELETAARRDRAALFACARAVAITGEGRGVVPEVVEAWAYGKPVIAPATIPGAATLIRETGAGRVIPSPQEWPLALAELGDDATLQRLAEPGIAYVERRGSWQLVAQRASEAIDAIAALDDGRSRDALLAQIAYLYPLVQRQRRVIEAMRVSRFWRLRDSWFGLKRRLGIGPLADPIPEPTTDERAAALAALGDPYQLFRDRHRLRPEDVDRMRATIRVLPRTVTFGLLVDLRGRELDGVRESLRSLSDQVYPHWNARLLMDDDLGDEARHQLDAMIAEDARFLRAGDDRYGDAAFVGPLDPHDRLEPHALFECALALQNDDADVVYSDEDCIDERGVPSDPFFKPDWSPETLLTRDYVGRMLLIRRSVVESVGGVRDVFESARWYDTLLRATDRSDRVVHIPQVLYHRDGRNASRGADVALAVEAALRRRGEHGQVERLENGVEVRFAVSDERVCIVIPTRDRADLLEPCLRSIFERTTHPSFEVVVVDNGSRESRTSVLLDEWRWREPERFRVLADPSAFNYSRLNNEAIASTDAAFIVMLNNDTEVMTPDWMSAMLGQARRPAIGAVGATLLYDDDTVQHSGVVLGILGLAGHAHRFLSGHSAGHYGALQLDTNYLAVTGACLMVEKRKLLEVGGLDESLAVSYNDVDLCLKLHRAGYRNVVVPRARLYHYESKSRGGDDTPAKVARAMQEVGQIRARWPAWSVRDPYYNPNLTVDAEDFSLRL